jgi:hypothetical protein
VVEVMEVMEVMEAMDEPRGGSMRSGSTRSRMICKKSRNSARGGRGGRRRTESNS